MKVIASFESGEAEAGAAGVRQHGSRESSRHHRRHRRCPARSGMSRCLLASPTHPPGFHTPCGSPCGSQAPPRLRLSRAEALDQASSGRRPGRRVFLRRDANRKCAENGHKPAEQSRARTNVAVKAPSCLKRNEGRQAGHQCINRAARQAGAAEPAPAPARCTPGRQARKPTFAVLLPPKHECAPRGDALAAAPHHRPDLGQGERSGCMGPGEAAAGCRRVDRSQPRLQAPSLARPV